MSKSVMKQDGTITIKGADGKIIGNVAAAQPSIPPIVRVHLPAEEPVEQKDRWAIQDQAYMEFEKADKATVLAGLQEEYSETLGTPNAMNGDAGERARWELHNNRYKGILALAVDKGYTDSHGGDFDAPDYVPVYKPASHNTAAGTYRQGQLKATYADLVEAFGKPEIGGREKGTADWYIEFETADGRRTATIYDWKPEGPEDYLHRTEWYIGGHDPIVVDYVHRALGRRL